MNFERDIKNTLRNKIKAYRKPLLLLGARQVGKTTVAKELMNEFEKSVYINLELEPVISSFFNESLNISAIIKKLELMLNVTIDENSLIIIDEIQSNPRAITSLKYFAEDGRYKVLATGSYLGVTMFEAKSSYPVGKVEQLFMYPLSFREFLLANSENMLAEYIEAYEFDSPFLEVAHTRLLELFDVYTQFGGYPEVVAMYLTTGITETQATLSQLIAAYQNDLSKYADQKLTSRLQKIYDNIPAMLASDNQKFRFTKVDNQGYKNLEYPIHWLTSSNLCNIVYRVESNVMPLSASIKDNSFKLLMNDTGLLMTNANYNPTNIINPQNKIYFGIIIEQYIGNVLAKYCPKLYYYHKNSTEIDYLIEHNMKVIPIEVKSGTNTMAKSLRVYNQKFNPDVMLKVTRENYKQKDNLVTIPVYLFEEYLQKVLKLALK